LGIGGEKKVKDKEKLKKILKKAGFWSAAVGAVLVVLRVCGISTASDTLDAVITAVGGLLVATGILSNVKTDGKDGDGDDVPPENGDGILP
jgi:uncharacterized membrane protein